MLPIASAPISVWNGKTNNMPERGLTPNLIAGGKVQRMPSQDKPWSQLYASIPVERDPKRQYVPPATDADLNRAEAELGFQFPESYRAFMVQFGPGLLVGYWIHALVPKQSRPPETVVELTHKYRESAEHYPDDFPRGEWNSGVVLFANNGPHQMAWHTSEKPTKSGEPPIFDLCSEEEQKPLVIADSFWKFVEYVEKGSYHPRNAFRHGKGGLYFMPGVLVSKKK